MCRSRADTAPEAKDKLVYNILGASQRIINQETMLTRRTNLCVLAAYAAALIAVSIHVSVPAAAFSPPTPTQLASSTWLRCRTDTHCADQDAVSSSGSIDATDRRSFLSKSAAALALISGAGSASVPGAALADDSTSEEAAVESIASRAARLSKTVEEEQYKALEEAEIVSPTTVGPPSSSSSSSPSAAAGGGAPADTRTMYDFDLPMQGFNTPMTDLLARSDTGDASEQGGKKQPKVVLFVNIKQDDVVARKNIPELIALASKFGRDGDFAVVCSPTDQGYYEPDTSQLIRLKLAQEYGYGINPATVVTDKVNLLGTGSHPFWRWIQGTGRAPDGLGRIRGNFEKFLVVNGRPVRRYPRKYEPRDIQDDIEALLNDRRLPPAGSNWREQWRATAKEAETDTYRFQKGLNVFDQ